MFLENSVSRSMPHLFARTMTDHRQSDSSWPNLDLRFKRSAPLGTVGKADRWPESPQGTPSWLQRMDHTCRKRFPQVLASSSALCLYLLAGDRTRCERSL